MTSDARVDSLAWSACSLLFIARRPPICHENMVANFRERYAFSDKSIARQNVAPLESAAERELLRFLELLSLSDPLGHVICVEAFELPVGAIEGTTMRGVYGCASPNLFRSEWVGFEAAAISTLQGDKAWLTNDVLSLVGLKFWNSSERTQPLHSLHTDKRRPTHGDITNQGELQLHSLPGRNDSTRQQEGAPPASRRRMTRSLASTMQRFPSYARLMTTTVEFRRGAVLLVLLALVLPTDAFYAAHDDLAAAVVGRSSYPTQSCGHWSDSLIQKVQGYLCSLKSWILIASCLELLWKVVVRLDEERAYRFVRVHVHHETLKSLLSELSSHFWSENISSRSVRSRWGEEGQRVNEVDAFQGGFVAHGNTYNQSQDHVSTTPLRMLWVVYAPLLRIVFLSVAMVGAVPRSQVCITFSFGRPDGKAVAPASLPPTSVIDSASSKEADYAPKTLPSLAIRGGAWCSHPCNQFDSANRLSMEIVKGGKTFIRPSCYLEFGTLLKNGRLESRVHIATWFRLSPAILEALRTSHEHA
ncbi:hypothetical protein PINS_up009260 [Pythium insidiosum]|nr:hypothetical protein PINS_up009260 [Pythium insidiosum]